jgi:hypothetical protein
MLDLSTVSMDPSLDIRIERPWGPYSGAGTWRCYDVARVEGDGKKTVPTVSQYLDRNAPIVRDRLKPAGVRLGRILNEIFASPTKKSND